MARLLVGAGVLALLVAAAHPAGRRALLRFAWWPLRDRLRSDWDRHHEDHVSPTWIRERLP